MTPLLGIGARGNQLNAVVVELIRRARERLVVYTPYFNLPGPVRRAIDAKLREGCTVTIILGDKIANDFYIPPDEPFKAIGALPYLYEGNLRRYCKARQRAIEKGLLNVHLWRHEHHTFHLKGLLVDEDYALLTGNNLNPRAWRMDLENGLLIHDPQGLMAAQNRDELERVLAHTRRLDDYRALEAIEDYPAPGQAAAEAAGACAGGPAGEPGDVSPEAAEGGFAGSTPSGYWRERRAGAGAGAAAVAAVTFGQKRSMRARKLTTKSEAGSAFTSRIMRSMRALVMAASCWRWCGAISSRGGGSDCEPLHKSPARRISAVIRGRSDRYPPAPDATRTLTSG